MPGRRDLPLLVTAPELEHDYRVRNATHRLARWLARGEIHQAGSYHPPVGRALPLYPAARALALADGAAVAA